MKLHDMTDQGTISPDSVPPGVLRSVHAMEDFRIPVEGILKLLKNLKPGKATGPDKLKPLLLQELCDKIAPILQIISERSLQLHQYIKKGQIIGCQLQTDLPHLYPLQGP